MCVTMQNIFVRLHRANFPLECIAEEKRKRESRNLKRPVKLYFVLFCNKERLLHLYINEVAERGNCMYFPRNILGENTLDVCTAQIVCDRNDIRAIFFYYFMRQTAVPPCEQYARSAISRTAFKSTVVFFYREFLLHSLKLQFHASNTRKHNSYQ